MNRRRIGEFTISRAVVETSGIVPEILMGIGFTPLSVEYIPCNLHYSYRGISRYFDKVDIAEVTPQYELNTWEVHSEICVEVKRVPPVKTYGRAYTLLKASVRQLINTNIASLPDRVKQVQELLDVDDV